MHRAALYCSGHYFKLVKRWCIGLVRQDTS